MEMSARKPLLPRRVLDLPIDALRPNPNQPRIEFDEASLRSLSDSIRRYGILQPLTVRRTDEGYELIAGERRLRAAKLAGLREVPCLLARSSEEESARRSRRRKGWGSPSPPSRTNCGCCACRPTVCAFCASMTSPSGTHGRCCA